MARVHQISDGGVANLSGLEVFSTVTVYDGEYLYWGNAFDYGTQLTSDSQYITNDVDDGAIDALNNAPASVAGLWYRYYSASGTILNAATSPTSTGGYYYFNADGTGGKKSHSGIYQKLTLVVGVEYQIQVRTPINTNAGSLYVNVYTPNSGTYILNSTEIISYPIANTSKGFVNSTFTAKSSNDILVIYFQTAATVSTSITISNISIKEKQDFLIPIYAEDKWGFEHKVLRKRANNPTFNTPPPPPVPPPPPDPIEDMIDDFEVRVAADSGGAIEAETCLNTTLTDLDAI
tara:strand:+ start:9590 stop:10462 length:873 start_codon:yes stop_codon:yes gene_type:complete